MTDRLGEKRRAAWRLWREGKGRRPHTGFDRLEDGLRPRRPGPWQWAFIAANVIWAGLLASAAMTQAGIL